MGSPMLLYAESLGASAKVTGIIFGLTPLMVALQIPAAGYVAQVGYKRFIATGWTVRLIFVLPLIAVPMLHGRVSQETQLAIVIGSLFCYVGRRHSKNISLNAQILFIVLSGLKL